ncbi:MAG: choice-of-anchor Q domain-containing protein [Chthoniobacterales bacterium]
MRTRLFLFSAAAASFCWIGASLCTAACPGPTCGLAYSVTSTGDGDNVGTNTNPDDGTGHCTLRAAIQAANSHAGDDGISFNIPPTDQNCSNGVCTINLTRVLPDLVTNMSITGPGANSLIIRRNAGGNYRIFHVTTNGFASFSGITITNGTGGIINDNAATLTVTDCIISNNSTPSGLGGAIYNNSTGPVTVTGTTVSGNSAGRGGAIFNNSTGPLTVTNSTLTNNQSTGTGNVGGGGIYNNSAGTVTLTNCKVMLNRAETSGAGDANGGGIYNESGTVNMIDSTLEANAADVPNGGANGGGIFNASGTLNISNCLFSQNDAGPISGQIFGVNASGGGICSVNGTLNLTNSTLNSNSCFALGSHSARGGGVFITGGTANITNSTITDNTCGVLAPAMMFGGGIFNAAGVVKVKSTIVALNRLFDANTGNPGPNPDVSGTFSSLGFNLIGKRDGGTGFTQASDQTGTEASPLDPKLDTSLRNSGGLTLTRAPLPGSPAIDKGSSQCLTCGLTGVLATDQRDTGFARTFDDPAVLNAPGGDGTDIGAFEAQSSLVTRLANVATRLPIQTGDNVLFAGFIVTGTQPKKVIIRALGPSVNVPGTLANPTLELHGPDSNGQDMLLASNDDWQSQPAADRQAVIDSTIPPPNDLESALVRTLPANATAYTAVVRGVNNGTGIGVVEVYDLATSIDSKLANISTRGPVQTGDDVLIAGTIILGDPDQKLIVLGIGPSLPLADKLLDPTLEVRGENGILYASNDNWVDSPNKQAIIDTGVAPSDNHESAILVTLPAKGATYTAILRGTNNTTGIAVVEVFAVN